jgi:uncharacterized lipoprotein YmbA
MHRSVVAALALTVALAAGCSSTPVTRYYLVTPHEAPAVAPANGPSVVVAAVRLPQYLERPQLVTRSADNQIQFEEYHLWGGNLGKDLTRVLSENLAQLLHSDTVVAAPHTLRLRPDFRVEVDVLRFERAGDGRLHLAAKWWLLRGVDGTPVAGTTSVFVSEPLPASPSFDSTVAAMSSAYGGLSRAIAQAIAQQPKAAP